MPSPPTGSTRKPESRIELARRLFREFYAACFWHLKPDLDGPPLAVEDHQGQGAGGVLHPRGPQLRVRQRQRQPLQDVAGRADAQLPVAGVARPAEVAGRERAVGVLELPGGLLIMSRPLR